jgi:hypothetical protein
MHLGLHNLHTLMQIVQDRFPRSGTPMLYPLMQAA